MSQSLRVHSEGAYIAADRHDDLPDIPRYETEEYITHVLRQSELCDSTDVAIIEGAITGWSKLIAPFTPLHPPKLSPDDPILDTVAMFISAMVLRTEKLIQKPSILASLQSAVLPLWPTIWSWVQTLHESKGSIRALLRPQFLKVKYYGIRYTAICDALIFYLHNEPNVVLSTAAKQSEAVVALAATLWIEEAKDNESFCGYEAVSLLRPGIRPTPRITLDILHRIVTTCGGSNAAVLRLLFRRIKRSSKQMDSDLDLRYLGYEFAFAMDHIVDDDDRPTALQEAFLSNAAFSVRFMVNAMVSLHQTNATILRGDANMRLALMQIPFLLVLKIMNSSQVHEGLSELLITPFFNLLAGVNSVRESSGSTLQEMLPHLLQNVLLRFASHRNLLLAMKQNIKVAFPRAERPIGPIADIVLAFRDSLDAWIQIAREYRASLSNPDRLWDSKVTCGNDQLWSAAVDAKSERLLGPSTIMLDYDCGENQRVKIKFLEAMEKSEPATSAKVPLDHAPPGESPEWPSCGMILPVTAIIARGVLGGAESNGTRDVQTLSAMLAIHKPSPLEPRTLYRLRWLMWK
ncbi:hypothetical protein HWV62_41495 [Athelia sp. TMB]|nr:hypothetical protein HWV62_41495 [Athelia sp. TMB]